MIYKGRQMRDSIFKQNKKENMFYAFQGFCFILKTEKEERLRREAEAERDAVEFALRNEVRFLLGEKDRTREDLGRVAVERARLKQDRRALAQRILYKHRRPYEDLEYCLWVWELWVPIRKQLRLEKAVEVEEAKHDAVSQLLSQTSAQLPPMAQRIDELKVDLIKERDVAHLEQLLNKLNPKAKIIRSSFSNVDLKHLLNTSSFDMDEAKQMPGWLQELQGNHVPETLEYNISSFVFRAQRPFHPKRLNKLFLATSLAFAEFRPLFASSTKARYSRTQRFGMSNRKRNMAHNNCAILAKVHMTKWPA